MMSSKSCEIQGLHKVIDTERKKTSFFFTHSVKQLLNSTLNVVSVHVVEDSVTMCVAVIPLDFASLTRQRKWCVDGKDLSFLVRSSQRINLMPCMCDDKDQINLCCIIETIKVNATYTSEIECSRARDEAICVFLCADCCYRFPKFSNHLLCFRHVRTISLAYNIILWLIYGVRIDLKYQTTCK